MQTALIILPAAAYVLLARAFRRSSGVHGTLKALVRAHLVVFAFIAVTTELLSLVEGVTFQHVALAWLGFLVTCVIVVLHRRQTAIERIHTSNMPSAKVALLVGSIILLLTTTLAAALLYPPNTWDSMTYHMPRVMHWISQQSVDFYPTDIPRQNYHMPLAEFAILHVQLLTGGDLFANLVQWVSYLCLLGLGPLVASELGLTARQQMITLLVTATLPMAILQASSTQNDLVVSAFLMSFALYMLRLRNSFSRENLLFAAISLGLALLTKGTAYIYAAAIGVALAFPVLKAHRASFRQFSLVGVALVCVVLAGLLFSAGHFQRNFQFYGQPLASGDESYFNQKSSVLVLGSNLLRNPGCT